ncbi:MAG: RNA polymerase sigma factor [Collinsella sp.]
MEHAIERHRGAVLRLALARTRNAADAQDVAQDVFIKLLRSTTRFHDDDHLRAWLLRATHDSCVDLHRQAWRRRVETREDMAVVTDRETWDPTIEEVVNHPVWTAMERLPDKLRCALHLHYVEGYGIAEVADILGCTEAAARTRLHRGRKKLTAELTRLEAARSAPASTPADPNDPTDPAMQPNTY